MAENMNLIPANELPEAVGDEVEVLCVENGQMKRKTGRLGGVYVIDLSEESLGNSVTQTVITSVSYNDFADYWYKGGIIAVKAVLNGMLAFSYPIGSTYIAGTGIVFMVVNTDGSVGQLIFANGTWTPPTTE